MKNVIVARFKRMHLLRTSDYEAFIVPYEDLCDLFTLDALVSPFFAASHSKLYFIILFSPHLFFMHRVLARDVLHIILLVIAIFTC